jgi:5,10-methylenetetrahydromethanopterin reductase
MPTYGFGLHAAFAPNEFAELCATVEEAGFERLWIPDERFQRDVASALTIAALRTERVGIGTAVTDPFVRHPALTAALAATVDEVSNGRLTLGIGAGISGFAALGIERARPEAAIRQAVGLMRSLWRGEHVRLEGATADVRLDFTPARPAIPVWIAGRGERILEAAGEIADGAMIGAFCSEPTLRYANGRIDRGLKRAGRPPSDIKRAIWLHTGVASDAETARDAVRMIVAGALISSHRALAAMRLPIPSDLLKEAAVTPYGQHDPGMLAFARKIPTHVLDHFSVSGTPSECAVRFEQLARFGIDHVAVVAWMHPGQSMRSFISDLSAALGLARAASATR